MGNLYIYSITDLGIIMNRRELSQSPGTILFTEQELQVTATIKHQGYYALQGPTIYQVNTVNKYEILASLDIGLSQFTPIAVQCVSQYSPIHNVEIKHGFKLQRAFD